jgi:molybdate transport system substrate-binding protein
MVGRREAHQRQYKVTRLNSLKLLSGGAAHGLVAAVTPQFTSKTGWSIDGNFGAVGGMAAKLRDGAAVDVMILTAALIEELTREGLLQVRSAAEIGAVETAIAVRAGDDAPAIGDENALRNALLAADAIFVPDILSSTAGIHVARVLKALGIFDQVQSRLKIFPNGATAMRELAGSKALRAIGCTQSTEIIVTQGLTLVGPLPPACALATVYSAAATTRAADGSVAKILIDILAGPDQLAARQRAGFLEISKG